jgi:hypothetical protein
VFRLSNSETQNALSDSQRRLTSRIGELQNSQERNKLLDEKNGEETRSASVCVCVCVITLFQITLPN